MKNILLNKGWKFYLDDPSIANKHSYWDRGYNDEGWQDVILPHDWSVEYPFSKEHSSGTGYLPGGIGWYRLHFTLKEEDRGKPVWILFDGVYKNSQVWCNSYYYGKWPNGYSSFAYRLDQALNFGSEENVLAVKVTHTDVADSRWFTGSGIYRKVSLHVGEDVFIEPMNWFMSTVDILNDKAEMNVNMTIDNNLSQSIEGELIIQASIDREESTIFKKVISITGSQCKVNETFSIANPKLWSADNPNLYEISTYLKTENLTYHLESQKIGICQYRFDPEAGFYVNGKPELLKGVCLHHDGGGLGAAVTKEIWLRRLLKLKDMGCNAIRGSHNPHMPELSDLCDELGFYMIDEAFDEWEGPKNKWSTGHNVYPPLHQGYYEEFPVWHKKDLESLILRDRNHPCIILWSVGNEIDYPNDPYCHPLFNEMTGNNDANKPVSERIYNPNRPNANRLVDIAKDLCEICHNTDPTRPTTMAIAFPELSTKTGLFEVFDVVGYNYKEHLYEKDHDLFPDKPLLGSENGHSYEAWKAVTENAFIPGQFLWTGVDFLGEAHGWPIRCSGAGLLTLAGFEKDYYYFRKSLWTKEAYVKLMTAPMEQSDAYNGHSPTWDYILGEEIHVIAYTNMSEAELFLDEESLGLASFDDEKGYFSWSLNYKPGTLKVIAKDERNSICDQVNPISYGRQIRAEIWTDERLVEAEIIQIEVNITDDKGQLQWFKDPLIFVETQGDIELITIENGDIADLTAYKETYRRTYHGQLLICLRKFGTGSLILKSEGLNTKVLEI